MASEFTAVFEALRDVLRRNAGSLRTSEDSLKCFCLEGGMHPTHKKPMAIAWVRVGKGYVSFHHMGVYAQPALLKTASKALKSRMQGKSCFNFRTVDPVLFRELEELTIRAFAAFKNAGFMS